MTKNIEATQVISAEQSGLRLDQAAAQLFPEYSRARLQQWIKDGELRIDGQVGKVKDKVYGGEELSLHAEPHNSDQYQPEDLLLNIVHEDDAVIIINKPVGLVVH